MVANSYLKGKSTLNQGDSVLVNMRTAGLIWLSKQQMEECAEDVIKKDSGDCSEASILHKSAISMDNLGLKC